MLLRKLVNIDSLAAQAGIIPAPVVNCSAVLFLKMNEAPKITPPATRKKKIKASINVSFITWFYKVKTLTGH